MRSIVLVIPSLTMGGAERVIVTLANGLAQRDWRVFLASPSGSGALHAELSPAVEVADLGVGRVGRSLVPLIRFLARHPQALVFSAMTHMNVVTLLATRLIRRHPAPVCVQEVALFSRGREADPPVRGRLARALMRALYRRADAVFCISQCVAAEVADRLGNASPPTMTIPNPVDLAAVRRGAAAPLPHPWLAEYSRAQAPILLGVGRLAPEKGFEVLLRALDKLRSEGGTHRLLLIGDGLQRPRLEALARRLSLDDEALQFVGAQTNPWAYMAHADAVVVPSHAEGFGLVLVEAMACGSQVVSTRCGAPEEILEGGRWGEMAVPGDSDELALAVRRALAAPRDPSDLRAVAARYDAETVLDRYAASLASLAGDPQVGPAAGDTGLPRRNLQ